MQLVMKFDEEIFSEFGDAILADLRQSIDASGIRASGNLQKSLRWDLTDTEFILWGAPYAFTAEFGRGPSQTSGGDLRAEIRKWIDLKGIIPDGITKDSLAFVITRSIHNKGTLLFSGTDYYGRTKPSEVLNGVINDGRINKLQEDLTTSIVKAIRNTLNDGNT
jgi:hypothetical protein